MPDAVKRAVRMHMKEFAAPGRPVRAVANAVGNERPGVISHPVLAHDGSGVRMMVLHGDKRYAEPLRIVFCKVRRIKVRMQVAGNGPGGDFQNVEKVLYRARQGSAG